MHYGKIKPFDIANGPGVRVSLFVSGCRNHCLGCFQPETWDFNYGSEYDPVKTANEILEELKPEYISGLSILGGDPLELENVGHVVDLCYIVKKVYPDLTIWVWTGYSYEDVEYLYPDLLELINVLVDGPFIQDLSDISLKWKGSRNQRVIDVKATKKAGYVVEVNE